MTLLLFVFAAAQEAVEENPSEEPAAPAHMEAPVQEASQPKAHDKRKKKKSNNKSAYSTPLRFHCSADETPQHSYPPMHRTLCASFRVGIWRDGVAHLACCNITGSKNFGGETSAERTVLGVRNVIADYEERLNAF